MPAKVPVPIIIAKLHNDPVITFRLGKHQADYFAGIHIHPKTKKAIIDWDEFADDLKQSEKDIEETVYKLRKEKDFDKMLKEAEENIGK